MAASRGTGNFPIVNRVAGHDVSGINDNASTVAQDWFFDANNPPFGQRSWLVAVAIAWIPADPLPQRNNSLIQPGAAVAANPPFSNAGMQQQIARSWDTTSQPQRQNPTRIVSVDNPPFSRRFPIDQIVKAWEPIPPTPRQNPSQISSVDNPPFSRRFPIDQIIRSWDPPQPPQPPGPKQRVSVDNPPFSRRPWQFTGDPEQQLPQRPNFLISVTPDNPPFGQRPWLSTVLASWIPPDPIQQRSTIQIVSVDDPAFARRQSLETILRTWDAPQPSPRMLPSQVLSVDNPPFGSRTHLHSILRAWEQDPFPQQKIPRAPGVPVLSYTEYGSPFLYTAANWTASTGFYFEVWMKSTGGIVGARLFDLTSVAPVAGSEVSTVSGTNVRLRSPAVTFTNGDLYIAQFGKDAGAAGTFRGAKIIGI